MKVPFWTLLLFGVLWFYSCGERLTPDQRLVQLPTEGPLRSAFFFDAQKGFVVGGDRFAETILTFTDDDSQTWGTIVPEPAFDQTLFDIAFDDEGRGVACGIGGKYLYTLDRGDSWRVVQSQYWRQMQGIAFADSHTVVSVGGNGYASGIIERSTNGGLNWSLVDTLGFELRAVLFVDSQVGFACGYGAILKTNDAGQSWQFTEAKREFFSAMSFPSPQIGFAVGRTGTIFKTVDQGANWQRLRNGNLATNPAHRYHAVSFIDTENGYIVGDKSLILRTQDGGENWQRIKVDAEADWWDVQMLNGGKTMICGTGGKLLWLNE